MARHKSPNDIPALDDLSDLDQVVVDQRLGQRTRAKKHRHNRDGENQFICNALTHRVNP